MHRRTFLGTAGALALAAPGAHAQRLVYFGGGRATPSQFATTFPGFTFSRASSAYGLTGASYATALYQSYAANVAIFEPLEDGNVGMLVSPDATNGFTYANDFSQAAWTKTNLTLGAQSVPLDTGNAVLMTPLMESVTNGQHKLVQVWTANAEAVGSFASFHVKAIGRTRFLLKIFSTATPTNYVQCFYDISTSLGSFDTISTGGQGVWEDSFVQPIANGIFRLSLGATCSLPGPIGGVTAELYLVSTGTTISYTGDVTKGAHCGLAQIEAIQTTSPILTTSAAASRAKDIVVGPVTLGSGLGMYVTCRTPRGRPSFGHQGILSGLAGVDTTTDFELTISTDLGDAATAQQQPGRVTYLGAISNAQQFYLTNETLARNTTYKAGIRAQNQGAASVFGGGQLITDAIGNYPAITQLYLGAYQTVDNQLNGHIIAYSQQDSAPSDQALVDGAQLPAAGVDWLATSLILPNALTFTRAGARSFFDGTTWQRGETWAQPRFDWQNGVPGFLAEAGPRTNKVTAAKSNPAATTNCTTSGDAAGVLSVVNDSANLGLWSTFGPNVYKLDNSAGVAAFYVRFGGTTGSTSVHSFSAVLRGQGNILLYDGTTETGSTAFNVDYSSGVKATALLARARKDNVTPANSSQQFAIKVAAGQIVYAVVPELEQAIWGALTPIYGDATGSIDAPDEQCSRSPSGIPAAFSVVVSGWAGPAVNNAVAESWRLDNGGSQQQIKVGYNGNNQQVLLYVLVNSVTTILQIAAFGSLPPNSQWKAAIRCEANHWAGSVNGAAVVINNSLAMPSPLNREVWALGGAADPNGWILESQLAANSWRPAMTDAELVIASHL